MLQPRSQGAPAPLPRLRLGFCERAGRGFPPVPPPVPRARHRSPPAQPQCLPLSFLLETPGVPQGRDCDGGSKEGPAASRRRDSGSPLGRPSSLCVCSGPSGAARAGSTRLSRGPLRTLPARVPSASRAPAAPPQHPPRASAAGGGPGAEQRRVSLQAFPGQWGEESHTRVLRLQGRTPSGLGRVDADDSVSGGPKGGQDVGASGKLLCRQVSRVSVLASVRAGAGASAGLGVSRAGEAGLVGPSGCVDRGPGAGVSGAGHGRPDGAGEVESMLFTRLRLRAKRACFALSTVHVSATFLLSFLEIIQKHQED